MMKEFNPDYCMNGRITFDKFSSLIVNGDSRKSPGVTVGYVVLLDDDTECFYAEWAYGDVEADEDGEVTPAGWERIEQIDEEQFRLAYAAYLAGEREYIG